MATLVTSLLSGGLLNGISGLINTIRGKSPEDAAKLAELAAKYQGDLLAADLAAANAQAATNQAEASNANLFVAGWRPGIGWVCGAAFAMNFIVGPLATWIGHLYGKPVDFPALDMASMLPVLLGMLGLGGMRSWEKVSGAPGVKGLK